MDNITSKETMEEFIGKIIDGQGNFFKPLSKSDLYKLATRIRELEAEIKQLRDSTRESDTPQMTLFDDHDTTPAHDAVDDGHDASHDDGGGDTMPPPAMPPRRVDIAYRGLDAQAAFDEFLNDKAKDPKRYSVMDFSTGKKSVAAAFAFWLTEPK